MVKRTDGVPPPPFPPAPPRTHQCGAPANTPKCMVCTTPARCGAPALHTKGPRCIGRADGKDDCDCLNTCGDDPWLTTGQSTPCEHRRETKARIAALAQATPPAPSPTAGMNIAQRILHVGGRNNAAGYVEFGSIQAVEALVRQVLRDLPAPQQEAQEPVAWRELCRRLYVELFHCNQQMTSGERPKWQQGKTVRDVLADAKAALDAAHQPSPAAQGDALPREDFAWLVVQEACETEPADEDDPECIRILRRDLKSSVLAAFLRLDAARVAQEGK